MSTLQSLDVLVDGDSSFGFTNYDKLKDDIDLLIRAADGILSPGLYKLWDSIEAGVSLPAASITTPSLPQTFKHLIVDAYIVTSGATLRQFLLKLNGAASYLSAADSINEAGTRTAVGSAAAAGIATAGVFNSTGGSIRAQIANYAAALKNIVGGTFASEDGSHAYSGHFGGALNVAAAVTTITAQLSADNFAAGTRITVYGEV